MSYIADVLTAYAAGDAFGVFHEFNPHAPKPVPNELLAKDGWPYGGISDDTFLTLLTIRALRESSPERAAARFLKELHLAAPTLRGLGPTTRHALGLDVKESEQHLIGKSNGGMMRTALLGLAFTPEESAKREAWITALVRCTHSDSIALDTALKLSAIFSQANAVPDRTAIPLPDVKWQVSEQGVSLEPRDTFNAVLSVAHRAKNTADAYTLACELGGDTDTVAALSGALITLVMRDRSGLHEIAWLGDVGWDEISTLQHCATILENFSKPTTWIIGPLAWDTVTYLDKNILTGGFVQSNRTIERAGGTGANVAIGLATTGLKVGFIGYIGSDELGERLTSHLERSQIAQLFINKFEGASNHVLIMISPDGERSMIGLSADRLGQITIDLTIFATNDTVVFVKWRDEFASIYQSVQSRVRKTVVGIEALNSSLISSADLVIGSHQDLQGITFEENTPEVYELLQKFPSIVITYGQAGAREFALKNGEVTVKHQAVFAVETVRDATGAGDAFLSGYLRGLSQPPVINPGGAQRSPLELGARWAALAVATDQSFPPDWDLLALD